MRLFSTIALLALAGCATPRTYINPFITDPVAVSRQMAVDDGYCVSSAAGRVPIPSVRVYSVGQQSYTVSGTGTAYGNSGASSYRYNSQVRSTPNAADAVTAGLANGMNIGAAAAARRDRDRSYHGCMVALGWATSEAEAEHMRRTRAAENAAGVTELQADIEAVPELATWQANDPRRWDMAVAIDKDLIAQPAWASDRRQRFAEVVRRVKMVSP